MIFLKNQYYLMFLVKINNCQIMKKLNQLFYESLDTSINIITGKKKIEFFRKQK